MLDQLLNDMALEKQAEVDRKEALAVLDEMSDHQLLSTYATVVGAPFEKEAAWPAVALGAGAVAAGTVAARKLVPKLRTALRARAARKAGMDYRRQAGVSTTTRMTPDSPEYKKILEALERDIAKQVKTASVLERAGAEKTKPIVSRSAKATPGNLAQKMRVATKSIPKVKSPRVKLPKPVKVVEAPKIPKPVKEVKVALAMGSIGKAPRSPRISLSPRKPTGAKVPSPAAPKMSPTSGQVEMPHTPG